jgi:anti-sigma28 factor (negative regulator of flagellin synthesis)
MAKKPHITHQSVQAQLLKTLDFTETQKQVDTLMKNVLHDNTLNENKIRFIQEQLHDQRYQIHPKMIAKKMFEHLDSSDLTQAELSVEV